MTHASLCKKTYKRVLRFPPIRIGRKDTLRSLRIAILLLPASAGMLSAQFGITTTTLPTATVGVAYSAQLQESGATAPVFWSVSAGSLPPALTLNPNSGYITGTPTSAGGFSFQVQAEFNSSAPDYATANLSIRVMSTCVPVFSPPSPLPPGDIGLVYPQIQFSQAGCPTSYTYSEQQAGLFSPTPLPPGLTLNSGGILSGTPSGAGTFSFLLTATAPNQQVTQVPYSITFNALPTVTTASPLPKGLVGVPYSQQIAATGGVPPYVFPHGRSAARELSTSPRPACFTELPPKSGTFNFNIGVTDSLGGQHHNAFPGHFCTGGFANSSGPPEFDVQCEPRRQSSADASDRDGAGYRSDAASELHACRIDGGQSRNSGAFLDHRHSNQRRGACRPGGERRSRHHGRGKLSRAHSGLR